MAEKHTIKAHKNHVDQLTAQREHYIKERGSTKTEGYTVPNTTYHDIRQLTGWWYREFTRAAIAKPWHKDPARDVWKGHAKRIAADLKGVDLDEVYPRNHWFWNKALLKLAIYLQSQKTAVSPTSLFIEAVGETLEEAGGKAGKLITTVTDTADTIADIGERAISGLKIVAIVGGSLIGAAIVVPPIVRAFRE